MKNRPYLLITSGLLMIISILTGFGGDDLKTSNGAPPGYTNSPADGKNCSHCMGGTATPVTNWITSDVPSSGYIPGTTYNITVTATGSGRKGFEVSPQDLIGNLIGTLFAGTGSKLIDTMKYVTHSSAVTTNPAVWNFQWKAPDPGIGDITFYGCIAVTKTVTKTTTMTISQSTVGISPHEPLNLILYPNPCKDRINVRYSLKASSPVEINLLSFDGRFLKRLLKENLPAGENSHQFIMDQPAGLYLLQVRTSEKTKISRIIKG